MEVISLILSGLALLVSVGNLILFIWRERRNNRRYETLIEYIDSADDLSIGAANKFTRESLEEQQDCFDEMFDVFDEKMTKVFNERLKNFNGTVNGCFESVEKRLSDLENGICPDYDAAIAAKESVDRFSEGVMNILCYGNPGPPKEKKEEVKEDKE